NKNESRKPQILGSRLLYNNIFLLPKSPCTTLCWAFLQAIRKMSSLDHIKTSFSDQLRFFTEVFAHLLWRNSKFFTVLMPSTVSALVSGEIGDSQGIILLGASDLRRSKKSKRFGIVRFIRVLDVDRLVSNLWKVKSTEDCEPVMVLDEACLNHQEYSLELLEKVKKISILANVKVVLGSEGFSDIELNYMGGLWIMIGFKSKDTKEKFQSCVGAVSWFSQIIQASKEFDIDERRGFWCSDGEMEEENNVSVVSDMVREKENIQVEVEGNDLKENNSDEPFNLYPLLNKKKNTEKSNNTESFQYHPGFTPCDVKAAGLDKNTTGINEFSGVGGKKLDSVSVGSRNCKKVDIKRTNGSLLTVMEELIKVVIKKWNWEVIVMGDFNEVRYKNERYGSVFHAHGADAFNSFISNANLQEIPLGGSAYTWCHRSASNMSKLDRFLMLEGLLSANPNFSAITLDRYLSDHRPIMLRESFHDYGPIPFRSFHYWFEIDGFEEMISKAWCESPANEVNPMLKLMYKMKFLKKRIREWNGMRKSSKSKKSAYKKELHDLETIIDQGNATDDMLYKRNEIIKSIQEVDNMEVAQKVKIKWTIEEDENTKYYHGIVNKKCNQLAIHGVLKDGIWIENPNLIDMESDVSYQEIKRAVWDCRVDKSSRPDGFTFGFIRRFRSLLEKDVVAAVKYFLLSVPFLKDVKGVKEKQVLMADKSGEVGKHGNVALGSNFTTRTQTVINTGLEFPTVS
nr:RNA-directed DNA polymerase, eukaryota, reverse transcriptase zinc-binding domain protein [Tanacetum cinerariifolium]